MGDHKKQLCKRGHPLGGENLVFNTEGFRECRICKYKRNNERRKQLRLLRRMEARE